MSFSYASLIIATAAINCWICPSLSASPHPRRILRPKDIVGELIRNQPRDRDQVTKQRYTIHTEIEAGSQGAGTELAMDVVEATTPAVTLDTIIKDGRGNQFTVREDVLLFSLLVTDVDTAEGLDTFAILAVNPETDDMHGIVEKRGKFGERVPYKIKQRKGENQGKAMAQEEMDLPVPDWHCDVGHDDVLEGQEIRDEEETLGRKLMHDFTTAGDNHDHKHHHHDHHEHDKNDKILNAESLFNSVRGIKVNPLNKTRRLQTASYHFQVDLFVEIDNALITKMGSLNNAINYVNTLVTGANVIYEKEIDTHLRVTNIIVSNLYDNAVNTGEALTIMRTTYGGNSWHAPDVDLHHALLGGISGGGIAYIGVVCRSDYGFGLTSGLSGNFVSLSQSVLWDMKGFMHELGHNFGSKHTNEVAHYDPVIDGCGLGQCPTTVGYGWSTIMSVCHGCPGYYENIMYTFGGDYDGSGDVNDLANWPANPSLVANYDATHFSFSPERLAQRMYLHVFSKASSGCVALSSPAPPLTPAPTPSPTSSNGIATYDVSLKAPKCSTSASFCDSGTLLNSRGMIAGAAEPNQPNSLLGSCTDGATGAYHVDESIDNIRIATVGGGAIQPGATIQITAKIWAYSASADFVDFFQTTDATNPQWQLIETVNPSTSGYNVVSTQYTLGNGSLQAVRVVIRYGGVATPCPGGTYDDVDDLAFVTTSSPTGPTTSLPTSKPTPLPTKFPTPMPTTPAPTPQPTPKPVSSCDAAGIACNANGPDNCCNGCQTKGRWANTCK